MVEMLVVVSIVGIFAAVIGALIALRIQRGSLERMGAERQAWERAQEARQQRWEMQQEKYATQQEARQQHWEMQQEKYAAELETRLTRQVQEIQKTWKDWEVKDLERMQALTVRFENALAQLDVEYELARLPLIEDIPLTPDATHSHQYTIPNWRSPRLQDINLSGRDLSHRYLGHADLRNTQLSNANLYMADLSGAFLTGANLAGADLSGANLAGADLRNATLTGANLLVADLYGTILVETDLRRARNLTAQQVYRAIYDYSTQFDPEIDLNKSLLPGSQPVMPASAPETSVIEKSSDVLPTSTPTLTDEPAFVAAVNTPLPTMQSEVDLLIPPQGEPESPLSSELPADDHMLAPLVTDLPEDSQEKTPTEESATATSRPARTGKKRAKVN
ncbi:MAG TPA: pentapeptide repeat-containing protein [Ktedonobacteraceae bacterium]|nr:pentapeptide repeat-containing protein [Ktedonobacteraceae bacterium]